jgi:hypothetical protein
MNAAFTVLRTVAMLLACALVPVQASDTLRDQEIASCLPGEIVNWGDQQDRAVASRALTFVYLHDSAPNWFDADQVFNAIRLAALTWSQCGITAQVASSDVIKPFPADAIKIQWSDVESRRNFGLANLGNKTLSLGPAAFNLLRTRNPAYDTRQTLQMVISHEMGHFFGLMAHSKRCVDVSSYYDNGKGEQCLIRGGGKLPPGVEYRSVLPTSCDIQRCRMVNGF